MGDLVGKMSTKRTVTPLSSPTMVKLGWDVSCVKIYDEFVQGKRCSFNEPLMS